LLCALALDLRFLGFYSVEIWIGPLSPAHEAT
jgi:hypothetical protein